MTADPAPTEGAKAADFTLPRDGGGEITLSTLGVGPVTLDCHPRGAAGASRVAPLTRIR